MSVLTQVLSVESKTEIVLLKELPESSDVNVWKYADYEKYGSAVGTNYVYANQGFLAGKITCQFIPAPPPNAGIAAFGVIYKGFSLFYGKVDVSNLPNQEGIFSINWIILNYDGP